MCGILIWISNQWIDLKTNMNPEPRFSIRRCVCRISHGTHARKFKTLGWTSPAMVRTFFFKRKPSLTRAGILVPRNMWSLFHRFWQFSLFLLSFISQGFESTYMQAIDRLDWFASPSSVWSVVDGLSVMKCWESGKGEEEEVKDETTLWIWNVSSLDISVSAIHKHEIRDIC